MTFMSHRRLFAISVATGTALMLALAAYQHWRYPSPPEAHTLSSTVMVTEQLQPGQIRTLAEDGYATIIDLRPDGEAKGQATAAAMGAAARANALNFVYIPVPHGAIPDSAVTALGKALANSPGPVLLYCRSGRRAARTWSLVEASRTGGLDAAQIIATVKASGQEVDDLKDALEQRIAARSTPAEGAP